VNGAELHSVVVEMRRYDPCAQRVRYVFFPSSGHEVLIVDDAVVYPVVGNEIRARQKHDGYSTPDCLAEEILSDVPYLERTPDLLLKRAKQNARCLV
jgi:hypothetical protein